MSFSKYEKFVNTIHTLACFLLLLLQVNYSTLMKPVFKDKANGSVWKFDSNTDCTLVI